MKTASSASAVANATILPLAFISNVFIISEGGPEWIETLGNFFPLRPFVESMQEFDEAKDHDACEYELNPLRDVPHDVEIIMSFIAKLISTRPQHRKHLSKGIQ